jgi:hypothetical protein
MVVDEESETVILSIVVNATSQTTNYIIFCSIYNLLKIHRERLGDANNGSS